MKLEPNKIFKGKIVQVIDYKFNGFYTSFLFEPIKETLLYKYNDYIFFDILTDEKYPTILDFPKIGDLIVYTKDLEPFYNICYKNNIEYPTKKLSKKLFKKAFKNIKQKDDKTQN